MAAGLSVCLPSSQALSDSQYSEYSEYLPWFGYQTAPAYRFPGLQPYHHLYYPSSLPDYHHQLPATPVLPEVTLQSSPPPAEALNIRYLPHSSADKVAPRLHTTHINLKVLDPIYDISL